MGRMVVVPRLPGELCCRLQIAAAWEGKKSIVDLLEDWSRDYLETRVLPSFHPDKLRWAKVLQRLEAQGLTQRQIADAVQTPLGTMHRRLRLQFQQPRRRAGGRPLRATKKGG